VPFDILAFFAIEGGPEFFWEEFLVYSILAVAYDPTFGVRTEGAAGQLWNQVLRGRVSIGIGLHALSERIHSCLPVGSVLRIELFLTKYLDWVVSIAFCRLGIERSAVDLLLESLEVPYLAFLSRTKWLGLLDVRTGGMLLQGH